MTLTTETKLDPFTLEIVKDSLLSAGDEMFVALGFQPANAPASLLQGQSPSSTEAWIPHRVCSN